MTRLSLSPLRQLGELEDQWERIALLQRKAGDGKGGRSMKQQKAQGELVNARGVMQSLQRTFLVAVNCCLVS